MASDPRTRRSYNHDLDSAAAAEREHHTACLLPSAHTDVYSLS